MDPGSGLGNFSRSRGGSGVAAWEVTTEFEVDVCNVSDFKVGEEVGAGVLRSLIGDQFEMVAGRSQADSIRRMKMGISNFFISQL